MRRSFLRRKKGLTLVEMIVVVSIIATVATAIIGIIHGGIKMWQRGMVVRKDVDVRIFFERLTGDLRNISLFSRMKFQGSGNAVSFPVLAEGDFRPTFEKEANQGQRLIQIMLVEYKFDPYKKSIIRKESDFLQISGKRKGRIRVALDNVASFKVRYYYPSEDDESELVARRVAVEGKIPNLVKIELTCSSDTDERKTFNELIEVPIAERLTL